MCLIRYSSNVCVVGKNFRRNICVYIAVTYPGIFFSEGGGGVSKNSVGDRGQRERGSGDGSPLVRGSTQFAN
jgi:hypothetical protein